MEFSKEDLGQIVADIPAGEFAPYRIGRLMTGGSI